MENIVQTESLDDLFKEPAPTIASPESVIVELQRGVINPTTGQWQTTAEVRELNGKDEEFLASLESNKKISYAMYVNSMVSRATVRIGDLEVKNSKYYIEELITGDRDILLISILKATYGPERTFRYPCSSCSVSNDITINIDEDFPIQTTDIDLRSPVKVKLKNGTEMSFRYPVGSDNIAMSKGETTAQQTTILIGRCVIWSEPKDQLHNEEWAKSLSLADRNNILRALFAPNVGPKLGEVKTQCATCGADIVVNVDWVSLLLA